MTLLYTPYVGILLLNGLVCALIGYILLSHRNVPGKTALILIMAAAVEVSLASALEIASVGIPAKVFWAKIEYLGNQSGPVLFLIFALRYTHQDDILTARNHLLLWVIPLVTMLLAATNDWHRLIWTTFTPNPVNSSILIYGHGTWYWVCTVYGYLSILAGCAALIRAAIRFPQIFRRQIGILCAAAFVPGLGNLIYLTGFSPVVGLDTAPVSFSLAMIILSMGIFRFKLLDIVPIARGSLIEHMLDGVVVLDARDRIADLNPAAQNLIGTLSSKSIGQPVATVLFFWADLIKRFPNAGEIKTEILLEGDPHRFIDLHITSLFDRRQHYTGRLMVLQDITEQRLADAELTRNIEELKIINQISLVITSGLDLERILKELKEQCTQVAPIDVFYVALYDPATSIVNIPLYYKDGQFSPGPLRDIRDRPGLIGSVIKAGRTLYLHNETEPITRPISQQQAFEQERPMKSYVGIPLTVRDKIIGIMSIQNHRPNAYADEQIHLLERIAIQAAIAIENARLYAEEQRLAIVDELTGVYNYRGLFELGGREVERAHRFGRSLAALFFDIDNFRIFNNTFSHATGNVVLQAVVKRCQALLRSVDILARYGGDEFVALLPETDLASAEMVAHRLIEEIAATPFTTPHGDLDVTVSIGVAFLTDDTLDLAALVDRANHAEHEAKRGQKSVVAIAK